MLVKCSRQSFLNNCKHFENIMQWINPAIISNLCIIIYTYLKSQKLESQTSDPGYKAGSGDETTSIIHVIEKRKEKPILYQKKKIYSYTCTETCKCRLQKWSVPKEPCQKY